MESVKWKGTALTELQKTLIWRAGAQDTTRSRQAAEGGKYVTYKTVRDW